MSSRTLHFGLLAIAQLLGATVLMAAELPATPITGILETEVSDVAVLPPPGPHRLLVGGSFQGGVTIVDGDSAQIQGQIYSTVNANFVIDPNNKYYYLAETTWSRGNRGARQDYVSIYDGQLKLVGEIDIPGRLISVPKSPTFDISADGRFGYVFNMQPAVSVSVVDLQSKKLSSVVETPGCALVYPFGPSGFASLCADGSLAVATLKSGKYNITRSAVFFDPEIDPVYEESLVDRQTGKALFITYTGRILPVTLGASPVFDTPWSLNEASGLPPASTATEVLAWRPGGGRFAAWHKSSGRLFVLMHAGMHWSHKKSGTELWVFDTNARKRVARFALKAPAATLTVSQDAEPLLFLVSGEGPGPDAGITVMDPGTGAVLRSLPGASGMILGVTGF